MFKDLADTLASVAATVAIVSALVSWYRSSRRPLKITRVLVHRSSDKALFILVVRNVKDYPVTIKRTECYRRKKYEVEKKSGGKPKYSELFFGPDMIFDCKETFEIAANGHTDIRISSVCLSDITAKLLFRLYTSHGYHELWSKVVVSRSFDFYDLEYRHDYESKRPAKAMYYWKLFIELTPRCCRSPRRS